MQLLFDLFPVLAFFVAYKLYDIFVATYVIIIAVIVQIAVHWLRTRSVSRMHLATAALGLLFGGITLILRDQIFIQWKPTVVNWMFAVVIFASHFLGKKPLVQRMMEPLLEQANESKASLPEALWKRVNLVWVAFFALLGALNLYVVYHFDEATWVNFKLFGMIGLTLVFTTAQAVWLIFKLQRAGTGDKEGV